MYVTKYTNTKVYAPDGALVMQYPGVKDASLNFMDVIDANGNYLSDDGSGRNYFDTLARDVVQLPGVGPTYSVLNSQGATSGFRVVSTNIPVATNFGQLGVTECNDGCTVSVIQSITLPDNTNYSFQYDCDSSTANPVCGSPAGQSAYYGTLISMTLPTGGQINYGYTTFFDSYRNASRWLSSRTAAGRGPTLHRFCRLARHSKWIASKA
jgi:hypothetical protein